MTKSIKDIARAAGVSPSTVSRVYSGAPGVGEETRKRVEALMKEMDYRPNSAARSLVNRKTDNMAIITPRGSSVVFSNPFFPRVLEGIGNTLEQEGYNLLFSFTPEQYKQLLKTQSVDGILLFAVRTGDPYLEILKKERIPTVVVGSNFDDFFPCVRPDDEGGIYSAVKYLYGLGHRNIVLVNGPLSSMKSVRCQEGFYLAATELGLPTDNQVINCEEFNQESALQSISPVLADNVNRPTAVLVVSDHMAIGVLKAASDLNLAVPTDVSVVGFGDFPTAKFLQPPLTTVQTDIIGIGRKAAEILIRLIKGKRLQKKQIIFPMYLVERGTVAPPQ